MMDDVCDEHGRSPDAYVWSDYPWPGIEGAVIVCREHGHRAPGEMYEDDRVGCNPLPVPRAPWSWPTP